MRRRTGAVLLLLCAVLMFALTGCSAGPAERTPGQVDPLPSASEEIPPSESETTAPVESAPLELTVDGRQVEAALFESNTGYSILYPTEGIDLRQWDGGETFELQNAPGSYLAVSLLDAPNLNAAVSGVQFEYAVDEEPKGILFGSAGYAGVRMTQEAGELRVDYILFQSDRNIWLVEMATFDVSGRELAGLLQAMLDSLTLS